MLELEERVVQQTVDDLGRKHLVVERSGFGSRVPKYQHRFCNTEFGTLKFDPLELAIVCELLVRGPQTPGELRTRAARMAPVGDVSEVEAALTQLSDRRTGHLLRAWRASPGGVIRAMRICSVGLCRAGAPRPIRVGRGIRVRVMRRHRQRRLAARRARRSRRRRRRSLT